MLQSGRYWLALAEGESENPVVPPREGEHSMIRRQAAPDSSRFEMSPTDVISKTVPGQRLLEQQLRRLPAGAGYGLALLAAFLLHGAVLSVVYFENWFAPSKLTTPEEVPIEIVAEPPSPQPPPPPPQPKPDTAEAKPDQSPPPPIDNEIATDAPRAASKEKIERKATDEATKTPPAPKETAEANPGGSAGRASTDPPQQGQPKPAESPSAPDLKKPDAEIIRPAVESGLQWAEQASRALAQGQQQLAGTEMLPAWSIGQQASNFERMFEPETGSAADETPIAEGKAQKTSLTTVYGMIKARRHWHGILGADSANILGVIEFAVDANGKLLETRVVRSSGSQELDAAALSTVSAAAPFPPPPWHTRTGMTYAYGPD
jgi:TonB family protein